MMKHVFFLNSIFFGHTALYKLFEMIFLHVAYIWHFIGWIRIENGTSNVDENDINQNNTLNQKKKKKK